MKIAIIGAGNVGGLTAMRLAQEGLGQVCLIDVARGLAQGKACDLSDARGITRQHCEVRGSDDLADLRDSGVVVVTAGFPRAPGMTREELLNKNARIIREISESIKKHAPAAVVVVVTNPLDLMARHCLAVTGFRAARVIGMGISLDAARFVNLISDELKVPPSDIDACVIGTHGEGMLPVSRLTTVKGVAVDEFLDDKKIAALVQRTVGRGLEIVTLLGSGSAYFAPSAAVAQIVRAIAKDEKRTIGVSAWLDGQYGIRGVCIGTPCRIGANGIEEIIEIELSREERESLAASAEKLKEQYLAIKA